MEGLELKKLSVPNVENIWNVGRVYIDAFYFSGNRYIHVAEGSQSSFTFDMLYSLDTGIWSETGFPFFFRICTGGEAHAVAVNNTTNRVYKLDVDTPSYQDAGSAAYTMTVQLARWDHGTDKRKTVTSVRLIADNQASGTATLEKNDNDYASADWVTLGTFDMTSMTKRITRCGAHRGGRAYRLTHSANTPFRAEALEIEYEVGLA